MRNARQLASMKTVGAVSLEDLLAQAEALPQVLTKELPSTARFELVGEGRTTCVTLDGRIVDALPMYQVKGLTKVQVNLSGVYKDLSQSRLGAASAVEARKALQERVDLLNKGLEAHTWATRPLRQRVYTAGNYDVLGGIVTPDYVPLSNVELLQKMMGDASLSGMEVVKARVETSAMDVQLILPGQTHQVDGGLKAGITIRNGQFGDRTLAFFTMLYRLLCTNGLMDVTEQSGLRRRHLRGLEGTFQTDVEAAVKRGGQLLSLVHTARAVPVPVAGAVVALFRRGYLNSGAALKTIERMTETRNGATVEGGAATLWGLTQAISAAARDYSISQAQDMQQLAMRLLQAGVATLLSERENRLQELPAKLAPHWVAEDQMEAA